MSSEGAIPRGPYHECRRLEGDPPEVAPPARAPSAFYLLRKTGGMGAISSDTPGRPLPERPMPLDYSCRLEGGKQKAPALAGAFSVMGDEGLEPPTSHTRAVCLDPADSGAHTKGGLLSCARVVGLDAGGPRIRAGLLERRWSGAASSPRSLGSSGPGNWLPC